MANQISIRMEGVDQLLDKLQRWEPETRAKIRSLLTTSGNMWVALAKRIVPVRTGRLRNSIQKEIRFAQVGGVIELAVGSNVKYAPFIEFGTATIAGGQVKAIGLKPIVSEAEAIKSWPALNQRGGSGQMMPWLRVSAGQVKPVVQQGLIQALAPPK